MVEAVEGLDFPRDPLGLAMIMHRVPRLMVCDGCAAKPIGPTARSILAGCTTSGSLARGMLHEPVKQADTSDDHIVAQHVDDLTQTIIADSERQVVRLAF